MIISSPRAIACAMLVMLAPAGAHAQAVIKVDDTVSVKLGFLSQMQADFSQNVRQDSSYSQNLFLRRTRLIMGVQIGSRVNVFLDTDVPNLGRATGAAGKALTAQMIMQDAWIEVKPTGSNAFMLTAGLQSAPLCRNCLTGVVSILPVDLGSYSFQQAAVTGANGGRDVGLQAKGYLAGNKIEYRAGVFSGARQVNGAGTTFTSSNSLRGVGRLQVELLEAEAPTYLYPGTYLGRRRTLALGAGIDAQGSYMAWAADAFFSYPLGNNGVTAQANFVHYDGDTFFPANAVLVGLPRQGTLEVEAGYHFTELKFTPFAKYESRDVDDAYNTNAVNLDEHRVQIGGTYYVSGHNLNIKAAYTRGTLERLPLGSPAYTQNGFTIQLQAYYF